MSLLQNSNAIQTGGYNIANSLRFQSASTTYASRTLSTTSQTKFTYSAWVKRGQLGSGLSATLFSTPYNTSGSGNISSVIYFNNDNLVIQSHDGTTTPTNQLVTSAVYRDPSAWYHIVYAIDTTQATASNRVKLYVNGVQVTAFSTATYPTQNYTYHFNQNLVHYIGALYISNSATFGNQFDGYIAEQNWIDGTQLDASYFGETDTLTGQWVAKKYTGTYGTNGFYLPFSNGTSTTTLGYDSSGNSNNWTLTNFTRAAGVSDCWMYDVPSGNGSSVGGTQPNSNYATLNPLSTTNPSTTVISTANLRLDPTGTGVGASAKTTFGGTGSQKYYFEVTVGNVGTGATIFHVAVGDSNYKTDLSSGNFTYYNKNGTIDGSTFATYTTGDVISAAVDCGAGTIAWYKNNVLQTTVTGRTYDAYFAGFMVSNAGGSYGFLNCGQRSFAYTPPSGYKALCTANLPVATIKKGNTVFDATLYTGTGTGVAQTITNAAGFAPDLVWTKSRSNAYWHAIFDTVRGRQYGFASNSTNAETTSPSNTDLVSFNSNGFTVGPDSGWNVNTTGATFVAWQWDAGSSTVTNTNGTISSQVRANPTAGVSVVTYTGTGANATVGHGLGVAPKMVIIKNRSSGSDGWIVGHSLLNNGSSPWNYYLVLNSTVAQAASASPWNNTAPTSSVFTVGVGTGVNGNTNGMVAYCFAEIAGFSKFGSYTGNGSADGSFIYTGFRPKYVMWKRSDAAESWVIEDTSRNTYNVANAKLYANDPSAEDTNATYGLLDILSNGFKCRTAHGQQNASGGTYIYMAFAEVPMAYANSR